MTTIKQRFLMTASELTMGRVMRAPDHDATTATAAPAATENGAADDDFAAFERKVTAPKAEPTEAPADDVTEPTEAGKNGTGEGEEPDAEGDKPAKKGKTVQERIDELTAARREAERQVEEAKRDAEFWRGKAAGAKPAEETPAAVVEDANKAPDPADYEYGEADPKFVLDTAKYGARQEFEALQQQEARRRYDAEANTRWQAAATAAAEKYPDFADKVTEGANRGDWPCTELLAAGIKASDVGADIAYHLANNKDEAVVISKMHPLEQARAFGRLEARFMAENKAPESKPTGKLTTDAPTPPENRARGSGGKFSVDDDTSDFAAFEAKHSARRK